MCTLATGVSPVCTLVTGASPVCTLVTSVSPVCTLVTGVSPVCTVWTGISAGNHVTMYDIHKTSFFSDKLRNLVCYFSFQTFDSHT